MPTSHETQRIFLLAFQAQRVTEGLEKLDFPLGTEVGLCLQAIVCAERAWGFGTLSQLIVKLGNPCMVSQKLAVSTLREPTTSLLGAVTEALCTSCPTCI